MTQEKKPRRKIKSRDEIEIVHLLFHGKMEEFLSVSDSVPYLGYKSDTGLKKFLLKHPEIKKHAQGLDLDTKKKRFLLKRDLDPFLEVHVVEGDEEEDENEEE